MLHVLKTAIPRQQTCRHLATSLQIKAAQPVLHLNNIGVSKTPSTTLEAVPPVEHPIFLTMCSLLNPKPDEVPAEDKVVALDPSVFGHPIRRDILHLCVNYYRDNLRQGSANTKTRGEVVGSGRKIRPQKGSGRARLGDAQSPMLRGGGVAFGPKPRDFSTDLPRKVRHMGMRVALSAKIRENALGVTETLDWDGLKTKGFVKRINQLGWTRTLFVTGRNQVPPRLERVSRNVPSVEAMRAEDLHVYEMLKWPRLVLDVDAVDYLERALGKDVPEERRIPPQRQKNLRFSRANAGRIRKRSPPIPNIDEARRPLSGSTGLFESEPAASLENVP